MFKFKISMISDCLFILLTSFLLFFTFLFYLLKNNAKAIALSLPFSIIVFCIYMILLKSKRGKLKVKREDEKSYIKCVNSLCLSPFEKAKNTVFLTLERLGKKPFMTDTGILCEDDFFFINFTYDSITTGGITEAYKKTPQGKNLVYVGVTFSDDAIAFTEGFLNRIKLLPLSELFVYMKKHCTIPDGGFVPNVKKIGFLSMLKGTFDKGKAKKFALYGGFLLIMSRFVFFPIWYIISGSLFLIYAITIKFFAPKPIEKTYI